MGIITMAFIFKFLFSIRIFIEASVAQLGQSTGLLSI